MIKALIIEPSAVYQMIISQIMTNVGLETACVRTGAEALAALKNEEYSLICMALHIGDMSSIDLSSKIRLLGEPYTHLPIVLITSEGDKRSLRAALNGGITLIFKKTALQPFDTYLRQLIWSKKAHASDAHSRVLYVDDSISTSSSPIKLLQANQMEVDHYTTADKALSAFLKKPYDLIITDLLLQDELAGYNLVSGIRSVNEYSDIPILITTTLDQPSRRISLLKEGANDFLAKPIFEEELLVRSQNLLRTKLLLNQVQEQQNYLHELAMRDQLTELYNRHFLTAIGPQRVLEAKKNQQPLSLLVIDLDHFKQINDTHGHAAGDFVLESVGRLLINSTRDQDIAIRFGGEEFALILLDCSLEQACSKAEEIRRKIMALEVGESSIKLTASIGASTLKLNTDEGIAGMFSRADKGLYLSKSGGRNKTTSVQN